MSMNIELGRKVAMSLCCSSQTTSAAGKAGQWCARVALWWLVLPEDLSHLTHLQDTERTAAKLRASVEPSHTLYQFWMLGRGWWAAESSFYCCARCTASLGEGVHSGQERCLHPSVPQSLLHSGMQGWGTGKVQKETMGRETDQRLAYAGSSGSAVVLGHIPLFLKSFLFCALRWPHLL